MEFQEALDIARREWEEHGAVAGSIQIVVDFKRPIWKGQILLSNLSAKLFDNYKALIDARKLVIGPALYIDAEDDLILMEDCVGVYYATK